MKLVGSGPTVAFFTVTRSKEYDYLLGSIEHHAGIGKHVVLDTTIPEESPKKFKNLPSTVTWVHEPIYGSGWKNFRFQSASQRALSLATELKTDVLAWLDSDDFYVSSITDEVIPHALHSIVELTYIHWKQDGHPYIFGESEWHRKFWPRWANLYVGLNLAWPKHKDYNGNPEHHALLYDTPGFPKMRIPGLYRNHIHYCLGPNKDDDETGRTTIDGWGRGGYRVPDVVWPAKLALWRDRGIKPSEAFL